MDSNTLRKKFLYFFKKRGHKIIPSSSLIPQDKTVLLTSAGMQQLIPYLSGKENVLSKFGTRHLASVQKCFRTLDIEEVGDDTHHTFFEMLGNWSIGEDSEKGYFKKGAIEMALDFFIKELGLEKEKLWVTVFKGEKNIPKDVESIKIWEKFGIPRKRIREFGLKDNFWGPVGETGPCGPCSEIHYDRGAKFGCGQKRCGPNCEKCQRFIELWNLVFMEYTKEKDNSFKKLSQRNVDTGIGFERLVAVLQEKNSAYETDLFSDIIKKLEEISGINYIEQKRIFRIIADHIRGAVFLIADGVLPSNLERGYVLRRVIRRAIRYGKVLGLANNFVFPIAEKVINKYCGFYPELKSKKEDIITVIQKEEEKFERTLEKGLKELDKKLAKGFVSGKEAFYLYETYGFPLELTEEIVRERGIKLEKQSFFREMEKHKQISRAGAKRKFGGIGREAGEKETKLHTATHLLHQALREVLGKHVRQMGSDINSERLRFDFSHPSKLTEEQIKKVEEIVNQKIKEDLEVKKEIMSLEDAIKSGALAFFKEKYPKVVSVYSIGNFSKEICGGPHVKRTSELGEFKIIKEESSGAGVRRIRAILK